MYFFLIYWRIIALLVSAIHQHESAMGIHMSPRSWTPSPSSIPSHPSKWSQSAGLNSLCPTGICYPCGNIRFHAALSIYPTLSFPHGIHCLCLHCGPANRFIVYVLILNKTVHTHKYTYMSMCIHTCVYAWKRDQFFMIPPLC